MQYGLLYQLRENKIVCTSVFRFEKGVCYEYSISDDKLLKEEESYGLKTLKELSDLYNNRYMKVFKIVNTSFINALMKIGEVLDSFGEEEETDFS